MKAKPSSRRAPDRAPPYGNRLLNDSLAALVRERKVLKDDALQHTTDRDDLLRRLTRPRPEANA